MWKTLDPLAFYTYKMMGKWVAEQLIAFLKQSNYSLHNPSTKVLAV